MSRCFASCRLVTTAATTVVVVYVTMQAMFGSGNKLDPCSCVSRDASCWCVYHLLLAKIEKFEIFENTIFLEKKDPLHPLPSVHVAEERVLSSPVPRPQLMSDASRLRSFGGRPSDIPNFLGLDNPVTGCQVGSILEACPICVCQVWYER